jgi:chromate reductase
VTARILLISGSTRAASTNTALLRTARAAAPAEVEATLYEGMTDLPHFNSDDDFDPLPPAVAELRRQIAASDAVLFCTPEYAGPLPGTFKNLLDWTVGGPEMYEKPVAWVNAAGTPTRGANAHA